MIQNTPIDVFLLEDNPTGVAVSYLLSMAHIIGLISLYRRIKARTWDVEW